MNSITVGNARFTVLTAGVVRMEYAEGGNFADEQTFFANRDAFFDADFSTEEGGVTVKTPKFTLKYTVSGEFSPENLTARIHTAGVDAVWHWGDENRDNLRGTLSTLDGVSGSLHAESCPYGYAEALSGENIVKTPEGLLARDGWHLIDDSGSPLIKDGWAVPRCEKHLCDAYLFAYGHDYKAAIRDLFAVSGKAPMPRKYFCGAWYSRWRRYTAEDFLKILDEYDENDFPLDVLVMDMDWHYQDWGSEKDAPHARYGYGHATNMGWTGYSWDRDIIPDPRGLLSEIHRRGIAVTLSDHPCDGVRDHEDAYPKFIKMLKDSGYREEVPDVPERISDCEREGLSRNVENFRFNAGSRKYMDAFFASAIDSLLDDGADFMWLDWQQDYIYPHVNGIKGLTHLQWLNRLYYRHSERNGLRGQSFSRWAGWGDQKHPGAFSGDIQTSFSSLEYEIQMTVSAGNAGCFWWTHDIGGFADVIGHQAEVYCRWVQFGALSAALRTHSCGEVNGIETDRRPWKWGEPFCSAMRDAFHLRSCLMPYIYSCAYISERDCLPLLRPLYLDLPECEEAYRHPATYMFGDGLFVAPIYEAGVGEAYTVESKIWLPDGQWYDYFTAEHYDGGAASVSNGIFTFPLFVRAGYPLATQRYEKRMASSPLTSPVIKIFAGHGDICGQSELFEDDGVSKEYQSGIMRRTEIHYEKKGDGHTVTLLPTVTGYGGAKVRDELTVEIFDANKPLKTSAEINGAAACAHTAYDEKLRKITVSLRSVPSDEKVQIIVS